MTAVPRSTMPPLAAGDASGAELERLFRSLRFPHVSDAMVMNDPHLKGAAAQSARGFAKVRPRQTRGASAGAA